MCIVPMKTIMSEERTCDIKTYVTLVDNHRSVDVRTRGHPSSFLDNNASLLAN